MSDTKSGRNVGRDALGILGLVIGAFSAVSVVMAATKGAGTQASGTTALYMGLVGFLGAPACVFASLGVALLGARLWLKGADRALLRHLIGIFLTTFTLSVLVGALDRELGGNFGGGLGGAVANKFSVWVAVPTGLALVLLPAWFVWLRPAELSQPVENPASGASKSLGVTDASSVTSAEAEALLPRTPLSTTSAAPAAEPVPSPYPPDVRASGGIPEGAQALPQQHDRGSQDQADVVREHHAGARPAALPGAHVAAGPVAPVRLVGAQPAVAPAARPGAARPDVPGPGARPVESTRPLDPSVRPLGAPTPARDDEGRADVFAAETFAAAAPAAPAPAPAQQVQALPHATTPPAPTWEQPQMFEEPVDAYGTPLSLVERLRNAGVETPVGKYDDEDEGEALHQEASDFDDSDADVESVKVFVPPPPPPPEKRSEAAEEQLNVQAVAETEGAVEAGVREDVRGGGEEEEEETALPEEVAVGTEAMPVAMQPVAEAVREEEVVAEVVAQPVAMTEAEVENEVVEEEQPVVAVAEAEEEEEGDEELEESDEEEELEPIAQAEEEADEEELEESEEEELEAVAEAEETEEVEADDEEELEGDEDETEASDELEESEETEETEEELDLVQPSLFADIEPEPVKPVRKPEIKHEPRSLPSHASVNPTPLPVAGKVAEPEPEPVHTISDVVLKPQPARAMPRVFLPETTYKAGCLFLERNRVAVSMLQREFQMDFKIATAVLDQLQDVGLIGPYLGGQRRDILMTTEEWTEKVGLAE
ncbi:MAG: hypothetical protein NTV21_18265 [Planctomycetota bacterium]|nr:hypothetical protein [Planctomycetota bacterium]